MMVRRRGHLLASSVAAFALSATLVGCGTGTADPEVTNAGPDTTGSTAPAEPTEPGTTGPADPTESEAAGATADPSTDASEAPMESPATEATTSPAEEDAMPRQSASGLRGVLLAAAEVPGFNDGFTWRERSTRMREGRTPFGTCHRFAMASIGATKVAVRTFKPGPGDAGPTASTLVARFADEKTAKRAYAVLQSWGEQCEEQLADHKKVDVGRMRTVRVDAGDAAGTDGAADAVGGWYLLTYGPTDDPDFSFFDAQGLTRVENKIALVQMRLEGQDYNYPRGHEPMVAAVKAAAARIG